MFTFNENRKTNVVFLDNNRLKTITVHQLNLLEKNETPNFYLCGKPLKFLIPFFTHENNRQKKNFKSENCGFR